MDPHQYCQQKAAASGSSFYYSFLFLPEEKRRAITALYAFCREVDDAVDECSDPTLAHTKLAWWRKEVDAIYQGNPQHPVARALAGMLPRFRLSQQHLNEIIDGMEMDLHYNRYPTFDALKEYCHRVAGVVGLLSAEIFGYRDPRTLEYAADLGLAFQLTNIIRDLGEDARRDRIYLPLDELEGYGVGTADITSGRESDSLRRLMEFQIERAFSFYQQAFDKLPAVDRSAQRPGIVMAAIYQALLEEIRADGCRVLQQRVALTPVRKLWIAWRTWLKG
ncbi:MAG: presqualene diphosphate synthase HpnD [Betaproteobacteria bacterium]|nr:presqualene diphosphate synthase HpnD [Betaproteobacteria bacterium]